MHPLSKSFSEWLRLNTKNHTLWKQSFITTSEKILVVEKLYIPTHLRGKGLGKSKLQEIIKNNNPDTVILVADIFQEQQGDFDLYEFYKKQNFKEVSMHHYNPIMVYPNDIATEAKETYLNLKELHNRKDTYTLEIAN